MVPLPFGRYAPVSRSHFGDRPRSVQVRNGRSARAWRLFHSLRSNGAALAPQRRRGASVAENQHHGERHDQRLRQRAGQEHPLRVHDIMRHAVACSGADQRRDHPGGQAEQAELHQPGRADLRAGGAEGLQDHRLRACAAAGRRRPPPPAPGRRRPGSAIRSPPARSPTWSSRVGDRGQHVRDRDAGHVGQRVGHRAQQRALVRRRRPAPWRCGCAARAPAGRGWRP